ncbi:hypothetical protein [Legionella septentrionalis]|uniref:hypothetical protein n=1 Tax=Legionella septentrionalis TaxID=2498109 RepID=UPI000F8DECD0|nr:hypothetical protein [Legionella septentrionalis]RUQ95063.1 hypothetical protein ELY11_10015 [Legionella septentrionalis]
MRFKVTQTTKTLYKHGQEKFFSESKKALDSKKHHKKISATQANIEHFTNLVGNTNIEYCHGAVAYRGVRVKKDLDVLDYFTPQGKNKSIEEFATVFSGDYSYVSTSKHSIQAEKFSGLLSGQVFVTNQPRIHVNVAESVISLQSGKMPAAAASDRDWDITEESGESELSGVTSNMDDKSVIHHNDVFMVRKTYGKFFYGPVYINPDFQSHRFTIQIPSMDAEEFKRIQKKSNVELISYESALEISAELEKLEKQYAGLRIGFPAAPPQKIKTMEEAMFYLNNFELSYIGGEQAEILLETQIKTPLYSRHGVFSKNEKKYTMLTAVEPISKLYPEFNK